MRIQIPATTGGQVISHNWNAFISYSNPVVTLEFVGVTSAGQLRLYPDDYTQPVDGEHDICDLLIAPARNAVAVHTAFKFNPLLLQGVNFRTTPDHILLCDARNY